MYKQNIFFFAQLNKKTCLPVLVNSPSLSQGLIMSYSRPFLMYCELLKIVYKTHSNR